MNDGYIAHGQLLHVMKTDIAHRVDCVTTILSSRLFTVWSREWEKLLLLSAFSSSSSMKSRLQSSSLNQLVRSRPVALCPPSPHPKTQWQPCWGHHGVGEGPEKSLALTNASQSSDWDFWYRAVGVVRPGPVPCWTPKYLKEMSR